MTVNYATGEIVEPLTAMERSNLTHAEATIERGLKSFVEVGEALAKVRDSRLYRETHGTFEAYCRDRWGITDRRARQMIDATAITQSLPIGTTVPANEGQARALSGLTPDEAAEAMRKAHEATDGKPTAAAITNARGQQRPASYSKPAAPRPTPKPTLDDAVHPACPSCDLPFSEDRFNLSDTECDDCATVHSLTDAPQERPLAPVPRPADEWTEQDRAEELAANLAAHVSALYALTDNERRAEYIALWHLGVDHRPVLGQKYVEPTTMRRIADALRTFAHEWEQANA